MRAVLNTSRDCAKLRAGVACDGVLDAVNAARQSDKGLNFALLFQRGLVVSFVRHWSLSAASTRARRFQSVTSAWLQATLVPHCLCIGLAMLA